MYKQFCLTYLYYLSLTDIALVVVLEAGCNYYSDPRKGAVSLEGGGMGREEVLGGEGGSQYTIRNKRFVCPSVSPYVTQSVSPYYSVKIETVVKNNIFLER